MNNNLGFEDIIKQSILKMLGENTRLTPFDVIISLGLAFILSLFVYYIYKKTFSGVLYTRSFNISLVMLTLVTTTIIMTISSNLTLSLGMVGALSIVRFRTAIKDTMDTSFLFWAISIGLMCGAGQYFVAISSTLIIALILLIFSKIRLTNESPYLLIINYNKEFETQITEKLKKFPKYKLKSKTLKNQSIELIIEIRLKQRNISIIDNLNKIEGIKDLVLINYNGDYTS